MQWRPLFVIACLFSALSSRPAVAAQYYVDPAGSDTAAGHALAPWRTIQHAADSVAAGDIVTVRPGIYVEAVAFTHSGSDTAAIQFLAEAGAVLQAPNPTASQSALDVYPGLSYLILDGFTATGGFHETIYVRPGAHDVIVRNCNIHHNRSGIWVAGATRVQIENCYVHQNDANGVRILGGSTAITVRDTTSSGHDDGLACDGDADGFNVDPSSSDVIFEGCLAENNGEDGFDLQGSGILVSRSRSRGNGCAGIKLWQGGRVENALVNANQTGVITSSLYNQPITVELFNSTIADNAGVQILLRRPLFGADSPTPYSVLLRNLIAAGPAKAVEVEADVQLLEDHNLFFRPDTLSRLLVLHPTPESEVFFTGQQINEGQWSAASGQGTGSRAIDPDFVDTIDYRPLPLSGAIDLGSGTSAPSDDLADGSRPLGLATDIGAHESPLTAPNHRPWPDPGPDRWAVAGQSIGFDSFGSVDPDGDPLSFRWSFGDLTPDATGATAAHSFAAAGFYTVTLTASDGALERARAASVAISPAPTATTTSTPTITPTPTATSTPTTTPTASPSRTPTSTPTFTFTPTSTPTRTPTLTPTSTPTSTPKLDHDLVLLPPAPFSVNLRAGMLDLAKKLAVTVRNADPRSSTAPAHPVQILVEPGTCPDDLIAGPARFTAGETVALVPGDAAKAIVPLQFNAGSFLSINRKTPTRCHLLLSALSLVDGNSDPSPANNSAEVEISVIDQNDPPLPIVHESFVLSIPALTLKIRRGHPAFSKTLRLAAGNGDVFPTKASPGHPVTLTVGDGTCPAGTAALVDLDPRAGGAQDTMIIAGGALAKGSLPLTVSADSFASRDLLSPARCVLELLASGPAGDADPSNDVTRVTLDVIDANDF